MPNRIISAKVSTERGELYIRAAQAAGLPHTSVTPDKPYVSLEGASVQVEPGKTWAIVETGDAKGSREFHRALDLIEKLQQPKK